MKNNQKTILFTGGHHNSALVVAKELKKEGYQIVWLGHKFTQRGDKSLSAEYQEVTKAEIDFYELKAGKFYRKFDPLEWLKIVFGFFQSIYYLLKIKPALIFASGGYLSVPVVIIGWVFGIPSITHEQTVIAGWANKAVSPFVKKILLTHQSSAKNFPKQKEVVVGLPVRKEILDPSYTQKFNPKLLYITCGKQGSHIINQALFPIIPELIKNYTVVHQTGSSTLSKDLEKARRLKEKLGELGKRYLYGSYFFAEEAAKYLRSAEIVISRSGAHSSYELMLLNKKSLLIPISWVSHNEQLLNAELVASQTNSLILEEKDLTPENLMQKINQLENQKKSKKPINLKTNATEETLKIIHQYL